MSWGKGITIAMIAFMTFILYMVFTLMSKNTDLESDDYYKKEIEFEKEIQSLTNTSKLKEKVKVSQLEKYVVIQFPAIEGIDSMRVELFRPNNEKDDQLFILKETKTLTILKSKLKIGIYNLNIHFKIKNESYMQKETIRI
ncbi:MAG: FixH family protein [Flavobacteriia bacterium]|nr:FixH family protein [Flavobacteriia bacterium]